jgi:hypothetical protein
MAEIRGRLPATRPTTVGQALSLLKIDYHDSFKWEHNFGPTQLMARCPFHRDRKPSLSIRGDTGVWICFAGCDRGTLSKLVERVCKVPRYMAERWVEGIATVEAYEPWEPPIRGEEEWRAEYGRPPRRALDDRGISREAATDLSIRWYRDRSAWVLPVWLQALAGHFMLLGWQYKNADKTWFEPGTPKSLSLFGIDLFETGTTAVLMESPLDVAVLLTAGLDGGLATFGTSVSSAQLQLLADRTSRVFLAMDNDDAGRKATEKIAGSEELKGKRLLQFSYDHAPDAKDPGEMTNEEIREGLRTAKRITR